MPARLEKDDLHRLVRPEEVGHRELLNGYDLELRH